MNHVTINYNKSKDYLQSIFPDENLRKYKRNILSIHDSICVAETDQVILDEVFDQKMSELTERIDDNISDYYGE